MDVASVNRMQKGTEDIMHYRRICDEFRTFGMLESKEGKIGFRCRVLVDFLTCENGFAECVSSKYADSRDDAVTRFGKILVKLDLIHHYRDSVEFEDDDGFFRFMDDEPALYFEKRQTVLSFRSPCREVRPGTVLWTCEDILLGSDLEVRSNMLFCQMTAHDDNIGLELRNCFDPSIKRFGFTIRVPRIL